MKVVLQNLTKRFPGRGRKAREEVVAVSGFDFEIPDGKLIGLLGPSGCGKSTTLNLISGLVKPTDGRVFFGEEDVTDLAPEHRGIGLVFQNYALYPHLTVRQNITFPLENLKGKDRLSRQEMEDKALEAARLVQIEELMDRRPGELSGGQQQRVAIARALVKRPKVLLLDEPLSNLDARLRLQTREEIRRIQRETGITTIFVTHDQEEALTMSDKIVVMKEGEIMQVGTPEDIYNEPANAYVAKFVGESNLIPGRMIQDRLVRFNDTDFDCVDAGFRPQELVDVVIRPEDIDIVAPDAGKLQGTVESVLFKGVHYEVMVETIPGTHITVNMHVNRNEANEKQEGDLRISANNFYLDLEDMKDWDDADLIARADAQAWNAATDELLPIERVQTDLKDELGEYSVTFHTVDGLFITRKIWVIDQKVVENRKVNEAVSAFNFFKTPDEIQESIALDTDLKTWANAQAWKLDDENETVNLSVEYDFDPENIREGIYPVTFWTTGREFKIHTTDFVEEGRKVGLTFEPEDIHVMEKMGFSE